MKRIIISCFMTLIGVFGLVATTPITASAAEPCPTDGAFLTFPSWYRGLQCENVGDKEKMYVNVEATKIPTLIWTVALNVLDILLQIAGIIAVFMILASAFQYLTNGGNEQKIAKAKTSLMQAVVGLAIALLASTLIGFIMAGLG